MEGVARLDHLAARDEEPRPPRKLVLLRRVRLAVLVEPVGMDGDLGTAVRVLDLHPAADLREAGRTLRVAGLEDLDDTRETVGDVRAGHAASVERPHRQLGARLADRLRGDDAHRVADLALLARREEGAVAGLANAEFAP